MTTTKERGMQHRLRLSEIGRWQIVDCIRHQSVAEHSYRVWVLALDLYDFLFTTPHNSFDREQVSRWAMEHDLDEVFTGDIPSTAKAILNKLSPGITIKLKDEVLRNTVPEAAHSLRGIEGSIAYYIVKIADIVEAMLFVTRYAVSKTEGEEVRRYLEQHLVASCREAMEKHHRIEGGPLTGWLADTLAVAPIL